MPETPHSQGFVLFAAVAGIIAAGAGAAYYFAGGAPLAFVGVTAGSVLLAIAAIAAIFAAKAAARSADRFRAALESIARGERIHADGVEQISELAALIDERENVIAGAIDSLANGNFAGARIAADSSAVPAAVGRLASSLESKFRNTGHVKDLERSLNELAETVSHAFPVAPAAETPETVLSNAPQKLDEVSSRIGGIAVGVKDAAMRVEFDSGNIETAAGALIKHADKQATDLESAYGTMASIARQASGLVELAGFTDSSLAEGDRLSRSLSSSVAELTGAARSTRREAQESLKRTKRIGERAQELSRAAFDLEEIADRMNILALNSSLRNAASDANRFLPEIKELAERVTQLTGTVSQLSQFLSTETRDTAGSMESVIREVILSSSLAEKAGAAAAGFDETASESRRAVNALSDAVRYQARITEELVRSLASVPETSEAVRSGSHSLTDAIRSLNGSLLGLSAALAAFKPRAGSISVPAETAARERFIN